MNFIAEALRYGPQLLHCKVAIPALEHLLDASHDFATLTFHLRLLVACASLRAPSAYQV